MKKSQKNKQESKIKSLINKNRKYLLALVPILFLLLVFGLLLIISPTVEVGFIRPSKSIASDHQINSKTGDLRVNLQQSHFLPLKTNLQFIGKEYKYNSEDLEEGTNILYAQRLINLYLFKLRSKDKQEIKFEVDRIAPELEIKEDYKKFNLLEDLKLDVKSEEGAKLFVNGKELEDLSEKSLVATVLLKDGDNSIKLFARDVSGNDSEEQTIEVKAFKKKGYDRVLCSGFAYPVKTGSYDVRDCALWEKATTIPCAGPCDFVPNEIKLMDVTWYSTVEEVIQGWKRQDTVASTPKVIHLEESFKNGQGISGKRIALTFESTVGGIYYQDTYVFAHKGKLYQMFAVLSASETQNKKQTWSKNLAEMVENLTMD